eukprot:g13821.t1
MVGQEQAETMSRPGQSGLLEKLSRSGNICEGGNRVNVSGPGTLPQNFSTLPTLRCYLTPILSVLQQPRFDPLVTWNSLRTDPVIV